MLWINYIIKKDKIIWCVLSKEHMYGPSYNNTAYLL